MDNIDIKVLWKEKDLIEILLHSKTEWVEIKQNCYISKKMLQTNIVSINEYFLCNKECYVEFGKMEGNYTPAFSIKFIPMTLDGHINIELNMEIPDDESRKHRCNFFVYTECGLLLEFVRKITDLFDYDVGQVISLNNNLDAE